MGDVGGWEAPDPAHRSPNPGPFFVHLGPGSSGRTGTRCQHFEFDHGFNGVWAKYLTFKLFNTNKGSKYRKA